MIDIQLEADIAYGCRVGRDLHQTEVCSGPVTVVVWSAGARMGVCMKHYLHYTDLPLVPLKELIAVERTNHD